MDDWVAIPSPFSLLPVSPEPMKQEMTSVNPIQVALFVMGVIWQAGLTGR